MDNYTRKDMGVSENVDARIASLEQLILEKDKKLDVLLEETKGKDAKIADLEQSVETVTETIPGQDTKTLPESMQAQVDIITKREQMVTDMLETLKDAFAILKERNDVLNKKEETLNREYLKLMEIESMYKGTERLADSLGSALPSFNAAQQGNNEDTEGKNED